MDISREEQRVLHALAQGGAIHALKSENGKITGISSALLHWVSCTDGVRHMSSLPEIA